MTIATTIAKNPSGTNNPIISGPILQTPVGSGCQRRKYTSNQRTLTQRAARIHSSIMGKHRQSRIRVTQSGSDGSPCHVEIPDVLEIRRCDALAAVADDYRPGIASPESQV